MRRRDMQQAVVGRWYVSLATLSPELSPNRGITEKCSPCIPLSKSTGPCTTCIYIYSLILYYCNSNPNLCSIKRMQLQTQKQRCYKHCIQPTPGSQEDGGSLQFYCCSAPSDDAEIDDLDKRTYTRFNEQLSYRPDHP